MFCFLLALRIMVGGRSTVQSETEREKVAVGKESQRSTLLSTF